MFLYYEWCVRNFKFSSWRRAKGVPKASASPKSILVKEYLLDFESLAEYLAHSKPFTNQGAKWLGNGPSHYLVLHAQTHSFRALARSILPSLGVYIWGVAHPNIILSLCY